jgi:hypothetical protein
MDLDSLAILRRIRLTAVVYKDLVCVHVLLPDMKRLQSRLIGRKLNSDSD